MAVNSAKLLQIPAKHRMDVACTRTEINLLVEQSDEKFYLESVF
jgi:hypothetical protein